MENKAIQDKWPDLGNYCWGCGNKCAYPGRGCGGIIATILDCHCLNTAASAAHRAEGREEGTDPPIAYATGSLFVKFLKPTPLNKPWIFRARVKEMKERKITVSCSLFVKEKECANGEIIAIKIKI